MTDWRSFKTALPAFAFAMALAGVPAMAQTSDDQQGSAAQQTDPQATEQASDPGSEANEDMSAGPSATADSSASGQHSLPFAEMDDQRLAADLSAQGYMNARDFVRSDSSVWLYADRDGQPVRIVVLPMAVSTSVDTTAEVGGTADADGGDGGSPATAEGGAAVGIGDASGTAGGDGGSTSLVARQDNEAIRSQVTALGYTNPREFRWSGNAAWAVADKDGEIVHIYLVPSGSAATVQ